MQLYVGRVEWPRPIMNILLVTRRSFTFIFHRPGKSQLQQQRRHGFRPLYVHVMHTAIQYFQRLYVTNLKAVPTYIAIIV